MRSTCARSEGGSPILLEQQLLQLLLQRQRKALCRQKMRAANPVLRGSRLLMLKGMGTQLKKKLPLLRTRMAPL